ncbi:MAG: YncE family protein [Planctomycetes bacterium]|nr:YncE family protein [Planctomycetota bacterium]
MKRSEGTRAAPPTADRRSLRRACAAAAAVVGAALLFAAGCGPSSSDLFPPAPALALLSEPAGVQRGNVRVEYTLSEPNERRVSVAAAFSLDGGATFRPATEEAFPGAGGTFRLAANRTGIPHLFVWDSVADVGLVGAVNAILRLTPEGGASATTRSFQLDNAFPAGRRLFVALRLAGLVAAIDAESLQVVDYVKVGAGPRGLAAYQNGGIDYLAVAGAESDNLTIIDLSNHQVAQTLAVGDNPVAVAFVPGTSGGDYLYTVNETAKTVTPVRVGLANVLTPQTALAVGNGPVAAAPFTAGGVNFLAVANAKADTLSIINADTRAVAQTVTVGDEPVDVMFLPGLRGGDVLFVPTRSDNHVTLLNAASAYAAVTDTPLGVGTGPVAVATTTGFAGNPATETALFVLHAGEQQVRVYRYSAGTPASGEEYPQTTRIAAPGAPERLAVRADGAGAKTLYYSESFDDRVFAIRVSSSPPVTLGSIKFPFRAGPAGMVVR